MKKDWEIKKLGDVGTFIRGGNFSKKDFVENGFPCIHYGQIHMKFGIETLKHISSVPSEMVKSDRCAKKGDLVIAITSEDDAGSCKCTAWMGDYDAYVGGHAAIYRHTMQPKYVSYYFNSPQFQKSKLEYTHGFKVVEINPKDIAKISVPVPPLEEQKRIVKILDEKFAQLESLKANAQTNLQNAKDLFQSQLTKAFSNTTWEKQRLGNVCKIIGGGTPSKKNKNFYEGEIPWASVRDMSQDILSSTEFCITEEAVKSSSTNIIPAGNIIIATRVGLGKVCILNQNTAINQDLKGIIPINENKLDKTYLFWYFKSISDFIISNGVGATVHGVKLDFVQSLEIPLPPLPEQKRIVKELDTLSEKVRQLQEIYTKQIANCDELKQAYLQKAFEGEI